MSVRGKFGFFLAGFILGGMAGAVAALLFAPQSGAETRALIKDKSTELRHRMQSVVESRCLPGDPTTDAPPPK